MCYTRVTMPEVCHLEAVPMAVIQAGSRPLKYLAGLRLVMMKNMSESVMQAWMSSPVITVTMYMPSCSAVLARFSRLRILPAIRHMIPKGEYLQACRYCATKRHV